jgi:hypothetical protein
MVLACWTRLALVFRMAVLLALGAAQAHAEEIFGNPFASAEAMRAMRVQRGATSNATLRVRYQADGDAKGHQQAGVLIIDVASNWALVQRGGRQTLYDFALGRVIELRDDGTFVSRNAMSDVAFRIFERQNRGALTQVLGGAGVGDAMDACDAETELGVVIPMSKERGVVEIKQAGATATLECNGRVVGILEAGSGDTAPAALWPVLVRETTMHPALQAWMSDTGSRRGWPTPAPPPRRVEAFFKIASDRKVLSWHLISAEVSLIILPYPLTANLINATAKVINETVAPGLGDTAAIAVAGRALGGAPTLATWDVEVGRLAKEKGAAAAALAMWPAFNMFPQIAQSCQSGSKSAICDSMRNLAATAASDSAVRALLDVIRAEQMRRPADAIAAMVGARSSPHAGHPVLVASFALALQSGGVAMHKQAEAAGVPSDAKQLHVRSLQAYPYNPAYWTDLGDYFARSYDFLTAYVLYDVAFSLPMPDAQRGNPALSGKHGLNARIRSDFPAFFLPK